jgi:hypothetical protein
MKRVFETGNAARLRRKAAAQNNGDDWLDDEISPEADYATSLHSARRAAKRRNWSIEDAARAYDVEAADIERKGLVTLAPPPHDEGGVSTNCEALSGTWSLARVRNNREWQRRPREPDTHANNAV